MDGKKDQNVAKGNDVVKENLSEELKTLKIISDQRKELEKKIEWEKVNLLKEK